MSRLTGDDGFLFHAKKGKAIAAPTPLAPLADTHGHLTSFRKLDAAEAVARAALAGVHLLAVPVDPADDVRDVPQFLSWFERMVDDAARLLDEAAREGIEPLVPKGWDGVPRLVDNVRFLAGVHPYGAQAFMDDPRVRERLIALIDDGRCAGVGEFGIDYGPWSKLGPEVQVAALREHLRIAQDRGLPVELHVRDADGDERAQAHTDVLKVLEEGVPEAGCDLHCFTSGPEVLLPFVELGCRVAFGGAVTFARSQDIRDAAATCPESLLLSETDAPYMAPVPLRGQECEPAMVAFSAACVADVREEAGIATRAQTYATLWHNACDFLNMG